MDTQFIGVSDDGLYFTKICLPIVQIQWRNFFNCKSIIAIHSELEEIIEENEKIFRANYGRCAY
jgi:dihydroorotase